MGKKKGKSNPSTEGQSQGSSQQQAPSQQQRPQPQQQAPTQQQRPQSQQQGQTQQQRPQSQQQAQTQQQHPRSQQQGQAQQQRPQSQQQAQTQQQRPQSQQQAPNQQQRPQSQQQAPNQQQRAQSQQQAPNQQQRRPRPKTTEDKPKNDDAKTSSTRQEKPAAWTPEYPNLGQQTQPQSSQSTQSTNQTAPFAWGATQQAQQMTTPFMQSVAQSQASLTAQQRSVRSKPRPKTEEQPTHIDTKASSSQSQAWVPEYAFPASDTSNNQPTDKPPSQPPAKSRPTQPPRQQARGGASSTSTLDESMDKLSLSNVSTASSSSVSSKHSSAAAIPTSALIPLTPYKGCGTRGQKVNVDVNFLPLLIDKLLSTVYQYDVTIEPNLPKRMLPYIFETFRKNNFPNIFVAFDGQKIAVSPKILPTSTKRETKVVDENGRDRVYMVAIKEANDSKIDFQSLKIYTNMRQFDAPLRAMQMLEIVLKSPFWNKNGVQAGRSFYMCPSKRFDLGDNYELWTGLYQATVLGSRPYLNVDIAHKAFPSAMYVIDLLDERTNLQRDLEYRDKNSLQSHLNGLMIRYAMPGNEASARNYKFLGLSANSRTHKFKSDQDKKEYTIEQYFRTRNVTIKYPLLPTLKLGNAIKNITVPMEFCSVAGNQAVNKKCTENQTRNMIKVAATSTDVRKDKIMEMLQRIAHNQSPTLKEFGIEVGNGFTNVPARILPAPTLEYKDNRTIVPAKGQWRIDGLQFLTPMSMTRYAVLVMDRYVQDNSVRSFCECINRIGRFQGMNIDTQYQIYRLDSNSRTIREELCREMSKMIEKNIELLFCVIPDRGGSYALVKQCAELECGILTQCIKQFTITRKGTDQSTVSNILLKVNAKLNGTNHKLAPVSRTPIMARPFMLIGADVTHPSPGQENIPSVVGVVSSHDTQGFKYNKCWRLQDPKQEMISDFDQILMEHLEYFERQHKRLPDVILYFRDGVSEGQFQQVLTIELNAMYRGCQQYKQGYKPKITFIVVQKRHHTRFFPPPKSNLGREDRKNNNVPAGTIVDKEITHPTENQFYLVSHQSIQGVARPTKYCLLRDDSDFPIDELQAITYNLCHFFARCTRSVSYPAPTYYAHLAAARGRVYIEGKNINMSRLDKEFKNCTVKQQISKNHPMYFI
ncbi:protein argonaute-2 isoform X2 [Bradysia coprophila]|uniref:protein argonaute-2 isoform X2 n=1 Tax=Bradysia coprophila TaxID=38358 RepID=UPI00187DC3D7|nr:protein argonaute-2 isoform X2 [Bradysia coprophila]